MARAAPGSTATSAFAATPSPPSVCCADATATARIDARGLVVAPGFIDIHSHGRRGIFRRAHRRELPARRRHHDHRRPRRQFAAAARAVSWTRVRKTPISDQLRDLRGAGNHPQPGDRPGQSQGHARGNREDEGAGRAGHARRRVRPLHRPVLRARQFHADRRSDRARQGGGPHGRHPHLAHARRGGARARQRARDHPHRRRGRPADADHASQDHRRSQLGQERGDARSWWKRRARAAST